MPGKKGKDGKNTSAYGNYNHKNAERTHLPTREMADENQVQDMAPAYQNLKTGKGESPRLCWQRSHEPNESVPVIHRPLFVQEKIHPGVLVKSLQQPSADPNMALFDNFNGLTEEQYTQWYKHKARWQNRLIHGNSLEISASLAEREGLAGKVQMIYFDPPYGINFKSNFAIQAGKSNSKDNAQQMGADPVSVTAFLDTWEKGIHSYLDAIHKHALAAHSLLAETGSFFVQIGNENMMKVGLILDEIFGSDNRMATISFSTSGSSSSSTIPIVSDYLLWYAKNKQEAKESYSHLYETLDTKKEIVEFFSWDVMLEQENGKIRSLTPEENENPDACIPEGSRLLRRMRLESQGHSNTGRSEPYIWNNRTFKCSDDRHWAVSHEGLDCMAAKNRLIAQEGERAILGWKYYEDEVPGRKINNVWHKQMSPSDKRYVVQTADSVVERCLLMSTSPGDLVLDFTCGSGTTPFVAEKWGRRWIAIDASQVAIATARTRLATSLFDYYAVSGSRAGEEAELRLRSNPGIKSIKSKPEDKFSEDPAKGFVYQRVPRVSAAILAYDLEEKTPPIYLVDRPVKVSGITRVCSPFTVESENPHRYVNPEEAVSEVQGVREAAAPYYVSHEKARVEVMEKTGIRLLDGRCLEFDGLEPCLAEPVTHIGSCRYTDESDGVEMKAAIAFAPEDTTVSVGFMRRAAGVTRQQLGGEANILLVCGFAFDPGTCGFNMHLTLPVYRIQMNRYFRIEEVEFKNAKDNAFVMLGEPDLALIPNGDRFQVEVKGFATFDPASGNARFGRKDDIYTWMLDSDYDGRSFFARHLHFPGQHRDKHITRLKSALARHLDQNSYDAMLSNKSLPFPKPENGQIAVKIITRTGDEMISILAVE